MSQGVLRRPRGSPLRAHLEANRCHRQVFATEQPGFEEEPEQVLSQHQPRPLGRGPRKTQERDRSNQGEHAEHLTGIEAIEREAMTRRSALDETRDTVCRDGQDQAARIGPCVRRRSRPKRWDAAPRRGWLMLFELF